MNPDLTSRLTRLTRIAVIAWLVVLTVAAAVIGAAIARLQQPWQNNAIETAMNELQVRIPMLETFKSETERKTVGLPRHEFRPLREGWDQRLDLLEQTQQGKASGSDFAALRERLDMLEHSVKTTVPSAKPVARKPRAREMVQRRTISTVPDFTPLGIELRGGERFLAIAPINTRALGQVRLLAVGDAHGRWQLQAMQSHSALFLVDQQMHRLNVPQNTVTSQLPLVTHAFEGVVKRVLTNALEVIGTMRQQIALHWQLGLQQACDDLNRRRRQRHDVRWNFLALPPLPHL